MPHSQAIGDEHERALEALLLGWGVAFERKKTIRTSHHARLTLDFWIPATLGRPSIVVECKTFGVAAKAPADSARRKTQEALWLLRQVRHYCDETRDVRVVIVTGERPFTSEQRALLEADLHPDVHIASIRKPEALRAVLELPTGPIVDTTAYGPCPLCRFPLAAQSGEKDIGDTAEVYEDCRRICRQCGIGLSNAQRPTYIRQRWEDGLWRRQTAARLRAIIDSSLNIRARTTKLRRLAHERSEDLLTWNVFSWLEDSGALPRLFGSLGLPQTSIGVQIFYWGFNDRYPFPCSLPALLQQKFHEAPASMSEPDVILLTDGAIVLIEVKLGSPNDRQPGRSMDNYLAACPGWFSSAREVEAAGYYELTRNWAIGAALSQTLQRTFALVNLVRRTDEVNIERTFRKLVTTRGLFQRIAWEDLVPACEPSLVVHLCDETLYLEPAFPAFARPHA